MNLEAADELQGTLEREFARARMQEIYDTISNTIHQARGDAPEHSSNSFLRDAPLGV